VLVISCPCALGLATPVAVTVGCGHLAEKGVLLRSAKELETLARINTVIFDKTGTLTEGRPEIKECVCIGVDEGELLEIAAALEAGSVHPLAKAVTSFAEKIIGNTEPCADMQDLSGRGIYGSLNGKKCYVGSKRYMKELGVDLTVCEEDVNRLTADGLTLVFVAKEGKLLGILGAGDTDLADSADAVGALRKMGVNTVMLSGDNRASAVAAARRFGIPEDSVRGDLLPADKEKTVSEMREMGRAVMMVGDGINDAPALARADVGLSMGKMGQDSAIEASDVVIMSDNLQKIPEAIRI
jgi:Cu+-exporting ATPase